MSKPTVAPMPTEAYFADNYGTCALGARCICLDPKHPEHRGWLGRACRHWRPAQAKAWDDLARIVVADYPAKVEQ